MTTEITKLYMLQKLNKISFNDFYMIQCRECFKRQQLGSREPVAVLDIDGTTRKYFSKTTKKIEACRKYKILEESVSTYGCYGLETVMKMQHIDGDDMFYRNGDFDNNNIAYARFRFNEEKELWVRDSYYFKSFKKYTDAVKKGCESWF